MLSKLPTATILFLTLVQFSMGEELSAISHSQPELTVDLHVGLWAHPLPCDFDKDGDSDLVVGCPDVPMRSCFYFENCEGNTAHPILKAPVRLGPAYRDMTPSYSAGGSMRVLVHNQEIIDIVEGGFLKTSKVYPHETIMDADIDHLVRGTQWQYLDFDGDQDDDLIVGISDWRDYGLEWRQGAWKDAYDADGNWKRGLLHGYVYVIDNLGTNDSPSYGPPTRLTAAGESIDVYGRPSPCFADFDADGDLDLICGEFLDGFTYFRNIGSRNKPLYEQGRRLCYQGGELAMHLQMIVPVAFDWDQDGDVDLIVGNEDGRVAIVEHSGKVDAQGQPLFELPYYFQAEAGDVYFGALTTPDCFDWDGDGDQDIISGNSAGEIGYIENVRDGASPSWAEPVKVQADGRPIRIMAGPRGSCQGPAEEKWGYTTLDVADWNHDGIHDLVVNSIWGKVVWYENIGSRTEPLFTASRPIEVEWAGKPPKPASYWWEPQGKELVTHWRTTPCVIDWNQDGLNDLVMMDHEGFLSLYLRTTEKGRLQLLPGKRIFFQQLATTDSQRPKMESVQSTPLRLNGRVAGNGGRVKIHLVDWDLDGYLDLLRSSKPNVDWLKGKPGENDAYLFEYMGPVSARILAGHTTSPTSVDWNRDGVPDMLVGAEDGRFYYLKNPHALSEK